LAAGEATSVALTAPAINSGNLLLNQSAFHKEGAFEVTYYIEGGKNHAPVNYSNNLYHLDHNTHLGFSKVLLMVAFCVVEPSIISVVVP